MHLKIKGSCVLLAISLCLLLGSACQSAKKPSAAAPGIQKTPPPPIQASTPPRPPASQAKTAENKPDPQTKSVAPKSSPAQAKPAPSDPVADLIAKVESEYQAGQKEYSNGHNDLAKQ